MMRAHSPRVLPEPSGPWMTSTARFEQTKSAILVPPIRSKSATPAHFFRDLPALCIAIATACFCGRPAAISVLMFAAITFLLEPFFKGMSRPPDRRHERQPWPLRLLPELPRMNVEPLHLLAMLPDQLLVALAARRHRHPLPRPLHPRQQLDLDQHRPLLRIRRDVRKRPLLQHDRLDRSDLGKTAAPRLQFLVVPLHEIIRNPVENRDHDRFPCLFGRSGPSRFGSRPPPCASSDAFASSTVIPRRRASTGSAAARSSISRCAADLISIGFISNPHPGAHRHAANRY